MLKRAVFAFISVLVISTLCYGGTHGTAFIYYYAWYANPSHDGEWMHWQESEHRPPGDVASAYYPKLGAYSSHDRGVIDQHLRWIAGANLEVLIFSWWGKGDFTDQAVRPVLDAALDYNLKVTFLIEPYPGRTPTSLCSDIEYLSERYGKHPAFYRLRRDTAHSRHPDRRGMFLIYDPDYPAEELRKMSDSVHDSSFSSLVLLQTTNIDLAMRSHADGLFPYEAVQHVSDFYSVIAGAARQKNLIFIPCVSPGFNINRTRRETSPLFRARNNGRTYDRWWKQALAAQPEHIAVLSFNEWHEGTQIEPAVPVSSGPFRYLSYEGAFGKTGAPAHQSYLRRTARWIDLFQQMVTQ